MTTFSIITVTYNAAECLQRTLDSVGRQDYPHYEHLIIDGASKDDTVAMARRYQSASRQPVTIVSEPDSGLYDAMNKGLQRATGDYLVFLNAGDTLHAAQTLRTVAEALAPNGTLHEDATPAVVYGDTDIVDAEGRFLRKRRLSPPERLTWRSFRQGMLVCHQAFYVSTPLARQTRYDLQYRHSADVDWCIRIMKAAAELRQPLVNAHAVLADFAEGGNTTQNHRASLRERYRVMSHHYGAVQTFLLHVWFVLRSVIKR